jgi:RimJ/RimL family protein N-acetyltransferase
VEAAVHGSILVIIWAVDVCLREWRADDAPAIAAMLTDPHLLKWSSMSEVGIDAWIAEQRAGHTVARRWLSEVPVATAPLLLDLGRKLG